jgi:hypothetical protein
MTFERFLCHATVSKSQNEQQQQKMNRKMYQIMFVYIKNKNIIFAFNQNFNQKYVLPKYHSIQL